MIQNRELGTGKYAFSNLDLVCICGHTLGQHNASRIKFGATTFQECFGDPLGSRGDQMHNCDCQCFKKLKPQLTYRA